jgi:hypothetical protein
MKPDDIEVLELLRSVLQKGRKDIDCLEGEDE